jgi:acyl-CoA dehydrogenase
MQGDGEAGLFTLPERYSQLQSEAAALAATVGERAGEIDERSEIDPIARRQLAESGMARVTVPAEYGGRFDRVDSLAVTVVREVLAGTSAHLDALFSMQGIGSYAISRGGSQDLRDRWLPAVASCSAIAALALTEPEVGSDLKSLTTTIEPDGQHLKVEGHKSFITNAGEADFYCVLGREEDSYSMVVVPASTAGVIVRHPHQIIAPHVLGDVVFRGVRVPIDHRIGNPGDGFSLVLATLATFRVSVAGAAIGVAQAALNEMVRHTTGRTQFGSPLAELGPVAQSMALSWTEIEMARSLTYRAAAAAARDPLGSLSYSSMAKVGATEVCGRVVDRAVQSMGRFGLVRGTPIERLYREARPMRIYEGATEVILDSLSKQLVKKQRGLDQGGTAKA